MEIVSFQDHHNQDRAVLTPSCNAEVCPGYSNEGLVGTVIVYSKYKPLMVLAIALVARRNQLR